MQQQFNPTRIQCQELGRRKVIADFDGGQISSDGGALLLRELESQTGLIASFASCFKDHRDPRKIEHSLKELLAQRILGIALGYEDLVDHDELRKDPLLAVVVNQLDPTGQRRSNPRDQGCPLAGKSTLNRLELSPAHADQDSRYKKIVYDEDKINRFFVEQFLDSYEAPPEWIVLDADPTDDPIHGNQEGRFYHGYYHCYCYYPLYIFCDDHLLCARLRRSNIDASKGTVDELKRIIPQIRQRWPKINILLRGDSGFSRDEIMDWCEQNQVYYLLGQQRNPRLVKKIRKQLEHARRKHLQTGKSWRVFSSFYYRTIDSWSRKRLVIAKSEHLPKGANPRFVVTNLPKGFASTRDVYEKYYCARGDMENRIKEQQLDLFADRTSTETMRANQLRLWFSSVAYMFLAHLRRIGLKGSRMAKAQAGTIRLKLLKIGAIVTVSVRRVVISLSSAFPHADLFNRAHCLIRSHFGNAPPA